MGGDHSITLPILTVDCCAARACGAGCMWMPDADVNDEMFGERETHGYGVFAAHMKKVSLTPQKPTKLALGGTGYAASDFSEAQGWGFKQYQRA